VRGNELQVSVGTADGVQVGDVYHIRRGFAYVGSLKITTVERTVARGDFDTTRKGPAAPPQPADVVFGGVWRNKPLARAGDYEAVLKELELVSAILKARSARSLIEGRVTSVRGDLVVISVGSADGVSVGDTFHLRRGAEFVGRVRIEKVEVELSVGAFDSRFPGVGAPPRKGDIARHERVRLPEPHVTSVRGDLVVISLGSEDGVQIGDLFHLRRGDAYVGQVRINKVERALAVGTFDSRLPGTGAPPQRGDVVYRDKKPVEKGPKPSAREGRLNSVRDDLVVISLGSDDGVRVGDVFHVRRGNEYVGQVVIDKVERNLSVGTFDSQFPGPGAPPQRGDVAYRGK
jgi:hypothetical protein